MRAELYMFFLWPDPKNPAPEALNKYGWRADNVSFGQQKWGLVSEC